MKKPEKTTTKESTKILLKKKSPLGERRKAANEAAKKVMAKEPARKEPPAKAKAKTKAEKAEKKELAKKDPAKKDPAKASTDTATGAEDGDTAKEIA